MHYALPLTMDGTGQGAMLADTFASFVQVQGCCSPIALATLIIVRRWHLSFGGAFLISGGKSLTEGLVFTGVPTNTILSPAWPYAPLMLAYCMLTYVSSVALPQLRMAPESLWDNRSPRPKGTLTLIALGFIVAFGIRIVWGLVLGPVLT